MSNPQDIKPQWLNIARRMQSCGRKQAGEAIVKILIVVDANGNPILWVEPKITKLEPQRTTAIREMTEKYGEEFAGAIIDLIDMKNN